MTRTTSNLKSLAHFEKPDYPCSNIHTAQFQAVCKQNYQEKRVLPGGGRPSFMLNAVANMPKGKAPIPKDIWKPPSPNPNPWNPCVEEMQFRSSRFLPYLSHVTLHTSGTSHPLFLPSQPQGRGALPLCPSRWPSQGAVNTRKDWLWPKVELSADACEGSQSSRASFPESHTSQ